MLLRVLPPAESDAGALPEWCLVELQGELATTAESISGLQLGTLHRASPDTEVCTLHIGPHVLEGAVVELSKPLLVLDFLILMRRPIIPLVIPKQQQTILC